MIGRMSIAFGVNQRSMLQNRRLQLTENRTLNRKDTVVIRRNKSENKKESEAMRFAEIIRRTLSQNSIANLCFAEW